MFYLDDFLELLEPFSVQFREDLERIGDLDSDVRHLQGELKTKSDEMFKECDKKQKFGLTKEQIHQDAGIVQQIKEIKKLHNKIKEKSEQKSRRMTELENKVDRCLRRCDSDLERFGNEIELEQPGITEQLAENALNLEPQKQETKRDYETDEDDYTPTPRRKPTHQRARRPSDRDVLSSTNSSHHASASSSASSSSHVSIQPPLKQRKLSLSQQSSSSSTTTQPSLSVPSSPVSVPAAAMAPSNSITTAAASATAATNSNSVNANTVTPHLARALSAPAGYTKQQLQLTTEFEETFGTSISQTSREGGTRPARVRKPTEKGKDWAHSLNNKNDLATFRIPHSPSPQSPNSIVGQTTAPSPSTDQSASSVDNNGSLTDAEAKVNWANHHNNATVQSSSSSQQQQPVNQQQQQE